MSSAGRARKFAALWRDHDVRDTYEGPKRVRAPEAGVIALEYSTFAVDGRARSQLGDLQSGDARGCGEDQSLVKPRAARTGERLRRRR